MKTGPSYYPARRPRRRPRTRGQALVEFAVVLPVFLLILSGILDFGFLLYSRMTVISSAREGARVAIDAPKSTPAQQAADPEHHHEPGHAAASGGLNLADLTVERPASPMTLRAASPPGTPRPAIRSRSTVTYDYHSIFPLLFGQSIPMSSTVQMVLE